MKRTALAACLVVAACSGSEKDDVSVTPQDLCANETRADEFVSGMSKETDAGKFEVRLVDVAVDGSPKPPDRGDNLWSFEVLNESGAAVNDATVQLRTWMPDHGHGTNPLRHDSRKTTDGMYEVGAFDVFMGGFWEFTFTVESGGETDTAEFGFCIEG